MIDIKMSELTGAIADKAVIRLVDKSVRRNALKMMGQDVRRMMRRSIKASRPGADGRFRSSRPGSRPFYRKQQGKSKEANQFVGGKFLIYRYDEASESVVVGPRALARSSRPMPETLEFGGSRTTNVRAAYPGVRFRKVGGAGEIRLLGEDSLLWHPVAHAKLRTARQADRANRINRELYLPAGASPPPPNGQIKTRVAARPYVRPTLREFAQSGKASELLAKAIQRSPLLSGGRR